MKKLLIFILLLVHIGSVYGYDQVLFGEIKPIESKLLDLALKKCEGTNDEDIPTVFIPGILASWYSKQGYGKSSIKRWIPDPITHSYDTLFYTFKQNGYHLKDVFYDDPYNVSIQGNPKQSLYLFGYDWKKDNKLTATLLSQLMKKIRVKYIEENGCDIEKVNIISHSMGGLVARAMLEDMCVSGSEIEDYKNRKGYKQGQIKNFKSVKCENIPKINKFITISTPHRGSPRSLPMWEKGDIHRVEDLATSLGLKSQLTEKGIFDLGDYVSNEKMYQRIHGYESAIPNGIVTIGQLLPDIKNDNTFNDTLKYLFKNIPPIETLETGKSMYYLENKYYPVNSFLEELNRSENINKMWSKISGDYTSYYSKLTGNYKKNNIVEFDLSNTTVTLFNGYEQETRVIKEDHTYEAGSSDVNDIYDSYSSFNIRDNKKYYNISKSIRNELGQGGDGTVPTKNLLLVPNNSITGNEVSHEKFQSIEIRCFDNNLLLKEKKVTLDIESQLYKNIGVDAPLESCSHTKTPISSAIQIYENISGIKLSVGYQNEYNYKKERKLLLNYIGSANYIDIYDGNSISLNTIGGIKNTTSVDQLFEKAGDGWNFRKYTPVLSDEEIGSDSEKNPVPVSLAFGNTINKLMRYEILSPINITIEDDQGRKIGINQETGLIENTIPGAWTSGDTEGTGEPEFFLVPVPDEGEINHKIKTYGTGDGEYHIVVENIDVNSSSPHKGEGARGGGSFDNSKLIIEGNAKQSFGEDYVVAIKDDVKQFKNISATLPTTLEIETTKVNTIEDTYKIRYSIRGDNAQVEKIKYHISGPDNYSVEKILSINGVLDMELDKIGKYSVEIELLDSEGKSLVNAEAKRNITIERKNNIFSNDLQNTEGDEMNLNQSIQKSLFQIQDGEGNLNFDIFNNPGNIIKSDLAFGLNHSYDSYFQYEKSHKAFQVLLPNHVGNDFKLNSLFDYEAQSENGMTAKRVGKNIEVIYDGVNYVFSLENNRLVGILREGNSLQLYYDEFGKLNYISNNKTNTLFFRYENEILTDVYYANRENISIKHDDFQGKKLLRSVSIGDKNVNFMYRDTGEVMTDSDVTNVKVSPTSELQDSVYDIINSHVLLNSPNSKIIYKNGNDGNLYSLIQNKIYKIDRVTKKRTLVMKNKEDIKSFFISNTGDIFYFDGEIHKYTHLSQNTLPVTYNFDGLHISDFVVEGTSLYYLNTLHKGYFVYDITTQTTTHKRTNNHYSYLGLQNDNILFIEHGKQGEYVEENPEFVLRYGSKINKLQEKIEKSFSKTQKRKLQKSILSYKMNLGKKDRDIYTGEKLEFFLNKLLSFTQ